MKKIILALSAFAIAPCCMLFAEEKTENPQIPVKIGEEKIKMPSIEASVGYNTMKIERGQVENPESVFGYEVELEWYGLFGGIETCYDMTNINRRHGRYNEIESFAGYRYKFEDLTAQAAYVYKNCNAEESDTQEVHLELEYETPWVTFALGLECDTYKLAGALYGVFELERKWEITDWLSASVIGGIGFGNPYRNDSEFEAKKWAFREMRLGANLEIELCPHVKLIPSVDFYDYFTDDQRHVYDKFNGFAFVAGCHLAVEF